MVRGKELSSAVRAQIMVLHGEKFTQTKIAGVLKISVSTVSKTIARAKQLGSLQSRTRSGRPRATSTTTDRLIHRTAVAHPTWSSAEIGARISAEVSPRTISRRLRTDFGLSSYKPARKAKLSPKNITEFHSVKSTKIGLKKCGSK